MRPSLTLCVFSEHQAASVKSLVRPSELVRLSPGMISRRTLLGALASAPLAACNTVMPGPPVTGESKPSWYAGSLPDKPYPVPLVDRRLISPDKFAQLVPYQGGERPGTIIVNIDERFLYLVQGDGTAIRYGVGVGKQIL